MSYTRRFSNLLKNALIKGAVFSFFIFLASFHSKLLSQEAVHFTPQELNIIKQFGPWPIPKKADLTNRFSQDPNAIALGQILFFDPKLSTPSTVSCATCHQPDQHFTDRRETAMGIALGTRNTPSLINVSHKAWFGWGGAADTLWGASLRAILNPIEMAATSQSVASYLDKKVKEDQQFQSFSGYQANLTDEEKLVIVGKLLAAYQETYISPESEFDRFRQALLQDDKAGLSAYSNPKKRGLKLFIGKGQCHFCHAGPLFSNKEFADIGLPYFDNQGQVDKGRYQGIKTFRSSSYTSLGPYNDDPTQTSRIRAQHLVIRPRHFGEFMVPSLRGISQTAPYMHQGSLASLEDVIEHYSNVDEERLHTDGVALIRPLQLNEEEKKDLISFLESL